jgi:hypothetical protein
LGQIPGASIWAARSLARHFVTASHGIAERICPQAELRGAVAAITDGAPSAIVGEPDLELPIGDARWKVPPSLQAMLQSLDSCCSGSPRSAARMRRAALSAAMPQRILARRKPDSPRRNAGRRRLLGRSDDRSRRAGDRADDCRLLHRPAGRSARPPVSRARRIRRSRSATGCSSTRWRMAAVAIIDVPTGTHRGARGLASPCTREEYDGPGRSAHRDKRLPYPIRYRPDALLNPAVFHDAMPASVIADHGSGLSPIPTSARAGSRASAPTGSAPDWPSPDSLRQLMRSDSARFLDRMFCADTGFAHCRRPWRSSRRRAPSAGMRALHRSARGLREARPALRRRRR